MFAKPVFSWSKCNPDDWFVYIVRCSDETLYTGIAKDLEARIKAHNFGNDGARYTKSRRPVALVYYKQTGSRSAAARLEHQIIKLPRAEKILLIEKNTSFK